MVATDMVSAKGGNPNRAMVLLQVSDLVNWRSSIGEHVCTTIFLPLGLPETDPFWANPPEQWSAQKIWSGQDFKNDHSVE